MWADVPNHNPPSPRVARLTDEEYETFKAMMQQEEVEDEHKSYDGSDDEDEEEDDPKNSYK